MSFLEEQPYLLPPLRRKLHSKFPADFFVVSDKVRIFADDKAGITMNTETMTQQIAEYFKTQPVLKAWLFGSFARGEETSESDVDILVILDHSQPVGLKFFGMWGDLERMLGRSVDLVVDSSLASFARESADKDKVLIYERAA